MKILIYRVWLAIAVGLWAGAATAGSGSAVLSVSITLNNPSAAVPLTSGGSPAPIVALAVCISETLSEKAHGMVRVMCGTDQFVSISPLPDKPFFGMHGGVFRYALRPGDFTGLLIGQGTSYTGAGTVTALPIYKTYGSAGPLEMLVSF